MNKVDPSFARAWRRQVMEYLHADYLRDVARLERWKDTLRKCGTGYACCRKCGEIWTPGEDSECTCGEESEQKKIKKE